MRTAIIPLSSLLALGCGQGAEAVTVELPVEVSAAGVTPVDTDLGYTVTVTTLRAAIRDIEFSIGGETHDVAAARISAVGPGDEFPHPGHQSGGEVTGELSGAWVIDWTQDGGGMGIGALLEGAYRSVNFSFRAANSNLDDGDGLEPDDPLLGHTFHIEGVAVKDSVSHPFRAVIDVDPGTQMVGGYFELEVTAGTAATLGLELLTADPFEPETVFDGIDFAALPTVDVGGEPVIDIQPGQAEHNVLRRNMQVHDHYAVNPR